MALTERDRTDITDLINRHGHLTDAGELDAASGLFTEDVSYDLDDFGLGRLHGAAAVREAALALGDANPIGHHVTNIVVTAIDDRSARVRSKGIGVRADGSAGSVVYDDVVTRGVDGWRISHRRVSVRRVALGGHTTGPHEVLRRWRRASVSQSAQDMRRLYAVDAVHEFPFVPPGVPSRLEGRDTVVAWMSEQWAATALTYERYRSIAVHDTGDPNTVVVEQEALGSSAVTGAFALPNLLVLTVRGSEISRLRDYVNVVAAAAVIGGG